MPDPTPDTQHPPKRRKSITALSARLKEIEDELRRAHDRLIELKADPLNQRRSPIVAGD